MKKTSLKMNRHLTATTILAAIAASIVFYSCKKDAAINITGPQEQNFSTQPSLEANGNSAGAHIQASESLAIPAAVDLPVNLPYGNARVATYYAVGVQKYKARIKPGSDPVVYEWVFVAPKADLYDITNAKVGNHGAGPFWTISSADSIFAQHFAPARTAPSPDTQSIDWLLLMPKNGTTPGGIFADVDYIQRIATQGGKAPLTAPASLSETVDVKYKAVYRFTKMN